MWDKKLKNRTIKKETFQMDDCGVQVFFWLWDWAFPSEVRRQNLPGKQGNPGTDESSADEKSICGRYAGRNLYGNGRSTDS